MSVEQIARDVVMNMGDEKKVSSMVTADAMASGGVLPGAIPMTEAFKLMSGLTMAFPDLSFDIQKVTVIGNQATVDVLWGGTNTGMFTLPIPGMPPIPATGKKVLVKDSYVVTVQGDKVSHFKAQSPADGGIPAALAQMGVNLPGM